MAPDKRNFSTATSDFDERTGQELSPDQVNALQQLKTFVRQGKQLGSLTGPAGTGKTTWLEAATQLLATMGRPYVVSAMTNKAAIRIHQATGMIAQTTYSAAMRPVFEEPYVALEGWLASDLGDGPPEICCEEWPELPELEVEPRESATQVVRRLGYNAMDYLAGWAPREPEPGTVLFIDEASMCGKKTLDIVKQVFGQIVLVGDPNQLPPVKDDPMLILAPRIAALETVHRHAGNLQVLDAAHRVLSTGRLDLPQRIMRLDEVRNGWPTIVHENATRVAATRHLRAALGLPANAVAPGERIVCRENYSRKDGMVNNSIWTVARLHGDGEVTLREPDLGTEIKLRVAMEELGQDRGVPFRFGYVMTAHTAQGSEWPSVTVSERQSDKVLVMLGPKFARLWRYTAVTRAKASAFFVGGLAQ